MTRRLNPDVPPSPQLAERVLAFFEANIEEALTREDVAEKFSVHIKTVPIALKPLIEQRILRQGGTARKGSPVTYSAGPGLLEGASAAKPAAPRKTTPPDVHPAAPVGWRVPTVAEPLGDRERHVLDYARIFLRDNDQMPTSAAIASAFGFKSPNAASEIMLTLERKGHLARNELGWLMFARYSVGMWVLA